MIADIKKSFSRTKDKKKCEAIRAAFFMFRSSDCLDLQLLGENQVKVFCYPPCHNYNCFASFKSKF